MLCMSFGGRYNVGKESRTLQLEDNHKYGDFIPIKHFGVCHCLWTLPQ